MGILSQEEALPRKGKEALKAAKRAGAAEGAAQDSRKQV